MVRKYSVQTAPAQDLVEGVVQGAGCVDDGLQGVGQVLLPVPVAQVVGGDLLEVHGIGLRRVPAHRLRVRHIEVVAARDATVGADQVPEHGAVAVGVQDAFDDVESVVQDVAGGHADQADVSGTGPVTFAQHDPAQAVLGDDGEVAAELLAQAGRDGGLA
ncbi:hypothetical protein GCM10010277_80610 [Streptomyces longisporoflavus]|nr:hypothetical protein GCM10010277_80610 [Streptomyces longisporoflavus]